MQTIHNDKLFDQMSNADNARVSTATFSIINALQGQSDLKPGECLAAILAAYILVIESTTLNPSDAIGITKNIMADALGRRPEFKAAADYLSNEVLASD